MLRKAGRVVHAAFILHKAVTISTKFDQKLNALYQLGMLRYSTGRCGASVKVFIRAAQMCKREYGLISLDFIMIRQDITRALLKCGKVHTARRCLRAVWLLVLIVVGVARVAEYTGSLLRAVYGDGHPDVAATLLSVARLKEQVGWTAAAAHAMWRSVKQLEDGRTQPVHSAMLQLAQLLAGTGQESDLLHEYAISKVRQIYGGAHLETLLATMQWSELIAQHGGATRARSCLNPCWLQSVKCTAITIGACSRQGNC